MSGADPDELLRRASAGDEAARHELLARFSDRLRRMIALRIDPRVRQRVDPSDIVQETLIVAERRFATYLKQPSVPFYPWLRRLAWDQLVACHRKHLYASRRSKFREDEVVKSFSEESVNELAASLADNSTDPLSRLIRGELRERVRNAIGQLPEAYREILILRHLEELSTNETAEVLGISVSAAKMRHLRAVERLQRLLDPATGEANDAE